MSCLQTYSMIYLIMKFFDQIGPLGRFGLVVVMSIYMDIGVAQVALLVADPSQHNSPDRQNMTDTVKLQNLLNQLCDSKILLDLECPKAVVSLIFSKRRKAPQFQYC